MSGSEEIAPQAEEAILAPKRFPGFHGNWERKELRPFLEKHTERVSADTDLRIYSSSREGLLPQDEYYGGSKLLNGGEYGVVPEGHFVYRHMSDDLIFKFNINKTGQPVAVSKEYPVFKTNGVDPTFLRYLLNDSFPFKQFAAMQRKGGARTRLYFETLCSWRAPLPSLPEQEHIAKCLASIDALIEAETEKLIALKDHKQGMMLELIPVKGETLPNRRFPEFQDPEGWVVKPLEEVADYENGKAYEKDIEENGDFVVVNARFISTDGEVRKYSNERYCIALKGDVLMVLSDLPKGRALAKCFLVDEDERYAVNQRVCRLTAHSIESSFLYYALDRHLFLLAFNDGLNQTHLSKGNVLECPIAFPVDDAEQAKIVSVLKSVDDQISSISQHIEQLKHHKQGLLQQLFPVLDGVLG